MSGISSALGKWSHLFVGPQTVGLPETPYHLSVPSRAGLSMGAGFAVFYLMATYTFNFPTLIIWTKKLLSGFSRVANYN